MFQRPKNLCTQKDLGSKKVRSKTFLVKKIWPGKSRPKYFWSPKLGPKFCVTKIWVRKYLVQKIFGAKKVFFKKNFGPQKIRPKKLGPKIFVKIGSVTPEIMLIWTNVAGTLHFMNKCHPNSWNLLKMVPGTYLLTAEIFLICTNVTCANVAWTNVTVTVRICSKYSQRATI